MLIIIITMLCIKFIITVSNYSHYLLVFLLNMYILIYTIRDPDNSVQFMFNMTALLSHLKLMKEKHTSPFYNVQLIKYEVQHVPSVYAGA